MLLSTDEDQPYSAVGTRIVTQRLTEHMQLKGQELLRDRQNVWRSLDACEADKRQLDGHHARFSRNAAPLEGPLVSGAPNEEVAAVVRKLQRAAQEYTEADQQQNRARSELMDIERRGRLFHVWLIVLAAAALLISVYLLFVQ
ncbi:hypothetical protein DM785_16920 (plasmid) [Deinococcus actinosclerus]|nr:hypothetical protein DM785_16920 [Deinococcus actinosclerus]